MKNRQILNILFALVVLIFMYGITSCGDSKDALIVTADIIYGDPNGVKAPQPSAANSITPTSPDATNTVNPTPTDPTPAEDPASGPCPGSGICQGDTLLNTEKALIVNFEIKQANPSILIMSFKADDMKKKQPGQLHYFQDRSRFYKFGSTYSLATPLFAKLKLPPNSRIRPEDTCLIQEEKDGKIAVHIKFSHD